jgi:hypothetical protein
MGSQRTALSGLALVVAFGATATSAASITTYTSRTSFLAAIGPTYQQESFDGFASGTALTTQIAGLVLSSPNSGLPGAQPVQAFASSGAVSPPNLLAGGFASGSPEVPQVIVIDFVPDVTAFGAYVSPLPPNSASASVRIDFRDQTSQTLNVSTGNGNRPAFLGITSDTGIRRMTYTATKSGQQGFRSFGADDLVWVAGDGNPPVCTAVKSVVAGVLGFDGTSTDTGPFDTGVASVTLVNGVNVTLTCAAPFPAACGSAPSPAPSASWRVEPTLPGVDGSGTVLATDASGNSCAFDVTFTPFPGGSAEDVVVCRDTGLVLALSNPLLADPGQIICSSTPPGAGHPPYPPGYEPSPASDPFPCTVFTIQSPISGFTLVTLKKDGDFEPRFRILYSRFDGLTFPPFTDVTISVDQVTTIIPDPTRGRGGAILSQVKIACAILAEVCNGLDDDNDGSIDEGFVPGGPAIDCDGDGYPQCATTATTATDCNGETVPLLPGAAADCNDQVFAINAGATETCNGLDDDCDGVADEGAPEGGEACDIPGLVGACGMGVTSCDDGPLTCTQVNFPADESCNGLDDDCDGSIDEGNPPGGGPCTVEGAQGVCADGVYSCADGPAFCVQTIFPTPETCNGLDDDCDGATDEDLGPEICNGIDDDCDEAIDEGLGTSSCGVGACAATVDNCVGGVPQTCVPGSPTPETCNGIDDDCDEATDEGLGTSSCGVGACAVTVDNCVGGIPQTCVPGSPTPETCNGIDDDCDGVADEGWIFSGYLAPVLADGSGIYQYGRTIPFKFRLTDCAGAAVTTAVATIEVIPYSDQIVGTVPTDLPANLKASNGIQYMYDTKGSQYMYNLGTKNLTAGRSYIVRTRISDGSVHDVIISLR